MAGKTHWEVYKDAGGAYRWRLQAANGRFVAASGESFSSKFSAEVAVLVAQKAATSTLVEYPVG